MDGVESSEVPEVSEVSVCDGAVGIGVDSRISEYKYLEFQNFWKSYNFICYIILTITSWSFIRFW